MQPAQRSPEDGWRRLSGQQPRGARRGVGLDAVAAGAADGELGLEDGAVAVEPAVGLGGDRAILETLLAFRRAGCDGILTYAAPRAARLLAA